MSNCSCKKIYTNASAENFPFSCDMPCHDVCTTPQCGDPKYLTLLAPVVYDELGVNVCRTVPLGTILDTYPSAAYITAEVIDIAVPTTGDDPTTITPINSRPNCYQITLRNLAVAFAIKIYDCCRNLLGVEAPASVDYLESPADESTDSITNPTSVTMEIFAPYGVAYTGGNVDTPAINVIGFTDTNNSLNQGLNLLAIPKVLNFDRAGATATIGLTLVVKSIYFNQYLIPHNGKAIISKGRTSGSETSVCMDFVSGSLLDRNIKPLEICNPFDNKEDCDACTDPNKCFCLTPSDS